MYRRGVKPELGRLLATRASWDDLALPLEVLTQLQRLSAQLDAARQKTPLPRYGPNPWSKSQLLFCGRSGAGKLLAARLIADDLGLAMWQIPSATLVGRYIGETEKNLARVFDRAAQTGWVLFFDEADALFGKRSGLSSSNSRYANQEVSYLLRRAEQYRGVVILSTRGRPVLGGSLQRRVKEIVAFP